MKKLLLFTAALFMIGCNWGSNERTCGSCACDKGCCDSGQCEAKCGCSCG